MSPLASVDVHKGVKVFTCAGKEAKVLKVLRLLRLTKLLRLVRAMRILKKYVSTATRDATHPGLVEHFLTSSCAYGQ